MSKTPFSKKCEILGELWITWGEESIDDEAWNQYFHVYDIGLPLSYFVSQGLAKSAPEGKKYVDAAWDDLCAIIGVDKDALWDNMQEMFDASPNERIYPEPILIDIDSEE